MSTTSMPMRGRWIPWAFVGSFAVVFAANAVMVTFAMSSWTGLETQDAYRKGLAYNRTLDAERRESALGWQGVAAVEAGRITVTLTDRRGEPVTAATVRAAFVRPTAEGHDFTADLAEQGSGRYAAAADVPLAGLWDIRTVARRGADSFQFNQRIVAGR
ncbi:nitrogen fixation protein FixH [Constrictibacter sp. MBR-5]|jgi:nitrogen fixation protein FixH|uniref:FixH family protein n=1 Tax=Constrictibacter sp. MBR-5 TaxID=3156467 RepID=UPI00339ABD61